MFNFSCTIFLTTIIIIVHSAIIFEIEWRTGLKEKYINKIQLNALKTWSYFLNLEHLKKIVEYMYLFGNRTEIEDSFHNDNHCSKHLKFTFEVFQLLCSCLILFTEATHFKCKQVWHQVNCQTCKRFLAPGETKRLQAVCF